MTTQSGDGTRYSAFDKLRAFCMLFIVFFHASLAYGEGMPWYVQDPNRNAAMALGAWATMGFTLRLFFVLAGFFARMLYQRRGALDFAAHRLLRIGIPFAVGVVGWSHYVAWRLDAPFSYRPLHLWFLEYLMLVSVIVILGVRAFHRVGGSAAVASVDRLFRRLMANPWAPLLLGIPTAVVLSFQGSGTDPSIIETPSGFQPHGVVLLYYTGFFGFGWLLHRHADVLGVVTKRYGRFLVAAVAVRLLSGAMFVVRLGMIRKGIEPPAALDAGLYFHTGVFTWLAILGLMGLFQRHFSKDHPVARYVSDASYWCYLVHLAPLTMLQRWLVSVDIPAFLKFGVVCVLTTAVCLISYEYLCRYTFIGWVLNGKRERPTGRRIFAWSTSAAENSKEST